VSRTASGTTATRPGAALLRVLGASALLCVFPATGAAQEAEDAGASVEADADVAAEEGADGAAEEAEAVVTIYGEVDFPSRYLWRGLAWSRGLVLQPTLGATAYGLDLWVGGNVPLTEAPSQGEFDEVDAGLGYSLEIPWFTLAATVQLWSYPNQEDSPLTGDLDVELGVPIPLGDAGGTLTIFTLQSVDIGSYAGAYYGEFGARYGYDLDDCAALEAAVLAGWASELFNETYIGPSINALNFVAASVGLTYYPLDFLYFRLHGQVSWLVDAELRDAVDEPVVAAGGIAVGAEYGF
jgi:hypothetical protein